MIDVPPPDIKQIELEEHQLRVCRWGFLLLGLSVFLEVFFEFAPLLLASPDEASESSAPSALAVAILAAIQLLPALVAALLLRRQARSIRWRSAAGWLIVTIFANLLLLAILLAVHDPQTPFDDPQSIPARALLFLLHLASWVTKWWIVALIAEFAVACRSRQLVRQTESLGNTILAGLVFNALLAGWMLPAPPPTEATVGVTTSLLSLGTLVILLIAVFWTFRLLMIVSALARLLANRCGELTETQESL